MDDTALMIRLLKRLKVEMNGAVTGAMRSGGLSIRSITGFRFQPFAG